MWVTGKTSMNSGSVSRAGNRPDWTLLGKQLTQAKTLLRQMQATIEDIEDARAIERAKRANVGRLRIPWSRARTELGLD